MSLDIWIQPEPCKCCGHGRSDISFNITHNISGMWTEAGIKHVLYGYEPHTVGEVIDDLKAGLALMESDPERFKKFDAPNGWGTYPDAVDFLREVIEGFEPYPDAQILVSR